MWFIQQGVRSILKVRHTLDCIAADTISTYIHIFMHNTGNKIAICQLQNAKSNFPKFCKVYTRQKSKNKSGTFIYTFTLILNSKIVFKKLFWLKLSILKKCTTCS